MLIYNISLSRAFSLSDFYSKVLPLNSLHVSYNFFLVWKLEFFKSLFDLLVSLLVVLLSVYLVFGYSKKKPLDLDCFFSEALNVLLIHKRII